MPTKKLADGTQYEKATHHHETNILKGFWDVTKKIDGVRAMRNAQGAVVSRNGKPLYNLDLLQFRDAEIFRKDWSTSVSLVRTESFKQINQEDVYELSALDYNERLMTDDILVDSTPEQRVAMMQKYVDMGYEGIVLRDSASNKWVKVVPWKTIDIRITGHELSDKRAGYIKNFETNWGKIPATGFPTTELDAIAEAGAESFHGKIAEMKFREWTSNQKMRFPAFVRWRFDKDEESLT